MTIVPDAQAVRHAYAAGFRQGLGLAIIVSIAHAESDDAQGNIRSDATLINSDQWKSVDRGCLQINSHFHSETTDACAFDPACAFREGFRISNHGTDFSPWVTFKQGLHKPFLARVRGAIDRLGPPYTVAVTPAAKGSEHLAYPFVGSFPVRQGYGISSEDAEPPGFLYPDQSIDYYRNDGSATRYNHLHCGIDLGCPLGTPLVAPAAGTVSFAGADQTGFGNCVKIDHGSITTLCGHLSAIQCKVGQTLSAGERFGLTGFSGNVDPPNAQGAHLHFSVIRNSDDRFVDPSPYLSGAPSKHLPDGITMVEFQATIMPGMTRVFDGPSTRCHVVGEAQPGNSVAMKGWMRGEPRLDPTTGKLDSRWYLIRDSLGWISSSRVVGNAPGSNP